MDAIIRYRWPGNVRELRNFVESVLTLRRGELVTEADVLDNIRNFKDVDDLSESDSMLHLPVPTHATPEQAERELLYRTLLSLKQDITEIKHFLASKFGTAKPATNLGGHLGSREVYDTKLRDSKVVETEVYNVDDNGGDKDTMTLNEAEKELIIKALKRYDGKRSLAAKSLGLSERTLYRKIRQYDLDL
jgi:DNA-binding NtrC family response regulator